MIRRATSFLGKSSMDLPLKVFEIHYSEYSIAKVNPSVRTSINLLLTQSLTKQKKTRYGRAQFFASLLRNCITPCVPSHRKLATLRNVIAGVEGASLKLEVSAYIIEVYL